MATYNKLIIKTEAQSRFLWRFILAINTCYLIIKHKKVFILTVYINSSY